MGVVNVTVLKSRQTVGLVQPSAPPPPPGARCLKQTGPDLQVGNVDSGRNETSQTVLR